MVFLWGFWLFWGMLKKHIELVEGVDGVYRFKTVQGISCVRVFYTGFLSGCRSPAKDLPFSGLEANLLSTNQKSTSTPKDSENNKNVFVTNVCLFPDDF